MKASLVKIVWNDWVALFGACAVPIVWAIHLAFPFLRRGGAPPLELTVALSALAAGVLAWRIARVKVLFSSGRRAKGVVTCLSIVRDRGRLEYAFQVEGTRVTSWCPVHRTRLVLALEAGKEVEILYDADDPRRSIVKDLFAA